MISAFPNSPTYTYRKSDAVPPATTGEGFEQLQCREKGDHLEGAAQRAADLFAGSDNTAVDSDPRPGFVRLTNVAAPGLLEQDTQIVSGFRTPEGDLSVEALGHFQGASTLDVSDAGKEITMQRPWYSNNMYLPTQEQLTRNPDGTLTVSWNYLPQ